MGQSSSKSNDKLSSASYVQDLDPASFSNFHDICTTHLHLDWAIDYDKRIITGSVAHTLNKKTPDCAEVIFDTSYLDIHSIAVDGQDVKFEVKERHPVLGSALHVSIPKSESSTVHCVIKYSTTTDCTAMGWLEKEQTASGKYLFMYTQGQAIHNRSLIPLQDTPGVKTTYSAEVSSIYPVLLSAIRTSPPPDEKVPIDEKTRVYKFNQPVTIPSYLIAVAAGELAFKSIGKRTGVWAEPLVLDAAVWEFEEDAEKLLETAEKRTIPYAFGRYDVLVLPNSFPYGGMENANLTFLTPTLLAGDRSLVDVVAHEMSHSWFGNLCTTASWVHFWLNEGFTTYLERLILHDLKGEAERGMSYVIGAKGLYDALVKYSDNPRFQRLVINYKEGEDPDDAFSNIPYEKGANFALYLERLVGGLDIFIPYLKDYVSKHAGLSITTDEWKSHLFSYFEKNDPSVVEKLNTVDWNAWLYGEGTKLPVEMKYDMTLVESAHALAKRWDQARHSDKLDFSSDDISGFTSVQTTVFLEAVMNLDKLDEKLINAFEQAYSFNSSKNAELRFNWYAIALKAGLYAEDSAAWVSRQGRMKFCSCKRPTYRGLNKVNRDLAVKTFNENKTFYHPIARNMIQKDLQL